jgi:hypothetical protein
MKNHVFVWTTCARRPPDMYECRALVLRIQYSMRRLYIGIILQTLEGGGFTCQPFCTWQLKGGGGENKGRSSGMDPV